MQRSLFLYWMMQGAFSVLDVLLGDFPGFFVYKFVLLVIVFVHVTGIRSIPLLNELLGVSTTMIMSGARRIVSGPTSPNAEKRGERTVSV